MSSQLRRRGLRPQGDEGSAIVEFIGVSVVLLLPVVYLMLTVFDVQRSVFAAGDAARAAGRAFATAASTDAGLRRAQLAANLSMRSQGITDDAVVRFAESGRNCRSNPPAVEPRLTRGESYVVCVRRVVHLPYADKGFFAHAVGPNITVSGQYTLVVDDWMRNR